MSDDARIHASSDGLGGAEVLRDGKVVAVIAAPYAVDAQGKPVPAEYQIAPDAITVSIKHRAADIAYPVLLDPVVDQQIWTLNLPPSQYGSRYITLWPYFFNPSVSGGWGNGLYSMLGGGQHYGHQTWAQWGYAVPGTAHAYRVNWSAARQQVDSTATRDGRASADIPGVGNSEKACLRASRPGTLITPARRPTKR